MEIQQERVVQSSPAQVGTQLCLGMDSGMQVRALWRPSRAIQSHRLTLRRVLRAETSATLKMLQCQEQGKPALHIKQNASRSIVCKRHQDSWRWETYALVVQSNRYFVTALLTLLQRLPAC